MLKQIKLCHFFAFAVLIAATPVATKAATVSSQAGQLQQISDQVQQACRFSGASCLTQVEQQLQHCRPHSLLWYELVLLKLDSMFTLRQEKALLNETTALLSAKDAPPAFRARLFIYHAKLLYLFNDQSQSQLFVQQAITLLDQLQQASPQFVTQLRLANLLLYMQQYDLGYQQLRTLEQQLHQSRDLILKYDLYNNLGHFALRLEQREQERFYRQQALQMIMQIDHPAKLAEAHYNLARNYYAASQWQLAQQHFRQAQQGYQQIADLVLQNLSALYLAECQYRLGQHQQARSLLRQIRPEWIPVSSMPDYHKISRLL